MPFTTNTFNLSTNTNNTPSTSTLLKSYSTLNTSRLNKTLTSQQLQKKFIQLYTQNQKWKAKKQKLRQQRNSAKSLQDMKQCTFKPSVNPQIGFNGSNPSPFLKRQMDWLHKKQTKIIQMQKQTQRKLQKQCSFHPKISQKTYLILQNPNKTSRMLFSTNNQKSNEKCYSKQNQRSYRQIHTKKQNFKQLQKTNSIHHFNLMTQRKFISKMQISDLKESTLFFGDNYSFSDSKVPSNTPRVAHVKIPQHQDYIQNIVIKSEEQDTFNSLSSLQMKTQRKDHCENDIIKQPVKIFEQEQLEEDEEIQNHNEEQQNQNDEQQNQQNMHEDENNQDDQDCV